MERQPDDYFAAIAFLEALPPKNEWTLAPVRDLCEILGFDPKAVPCILVTGTNGKGSVAAFCESAIRNAGYRTGRYISPHLVDYTERVSVDGKDISKADFARIILDAKKAVETYNQAHTETLSQFEVNTAVALKFFLDSKVDFAVLEIGMGGRLDSTNVAEPVLSIITRVSLDHTKALGYTVEKIAFEKAGVIRAGRPVVTGCDGAALGVIRKVAGEKNSGVVVVGERKSGGKEDAAGDAEFTFSGKSVSLSGTQVEISSKLGTTRLSSSLLGSYQCFNMAVAYAALRKLDEQGALSIPSTAIQKGFQAAKWPGRLEIVSTEPLVVLDGAHNPDGARALAASVKALFAGKRISLVCGMMDDKDVESTVGLLAPLATSFYAAPVSYHRTATAVRVAEAARPHCPVVLDFWSAGEALRAAVKHANSDADGMVLVAGSLYLVGEIKAGLSKQPVGKTTAKC
ncbi:MAG: folylpolyglutamate synthase/dihydrofolate synthase family protein [Candidatus Micrarchaeia archaeon]